MPNEYHDALADHIAGRPRRFAEGITYKLTRDQLEEDEKPRKPEQPHEKSGNEGPQGARAARAAEEGAGGMAIILAAAVGVAWAASAVWAWLTVKLKPVDAAIQSAVDLHPLLETYYFGVAMALLGPPMMVYEQTRSWLRWSDWFPWPAASKPIAWIAAILSACIIFRLLAHLLFKWTWLRWALPLVVFGPLVVVVAVRVLQRA